MKPAQSQGLRKSATFKATDRHRSRRFVTVREGMVELHRAWQTLYSARESDDHIADLVQIASDLGAEAMHGIESYGDDHNLLSDDLLSGSERMKCTCGRRRRLAGVMRNAGELSGVTTCICSKEPVILRSEQASTVIEEAGRSESGVATAKALWTERLEKASATDQLCINVTDFSGLEGAWEKFKDRMRRRPAREQLEQALLAFAVAALQYRSLCRDDRDDGSGRGDNDVLRMPLVRRAIRAEHVNAADAERLAAG